MKGTRITNFYIAFIIVFTLSTGFFQNNLFGDYSHGDIVSNFSLKDMDGNTVNLYDYEGYVILIQFFAWFCPFCNTEAPYLESEIWQYYRLHEGNPSGVPVVVLGIAELQLVYNDYDIEYQRTQNFIEKNGLTYPVLIDDKDRSTLYSYNPSYAIPVTEIINGTKNDLNYEQWELVCEKIGFPGSKDLVTKYIEEFKGCIDSINGQGNLTPSPTETSTSTPTNIPTVKPSLTKTPTLTQTPWGQKPTLSSGGVTPENGDMETKFTYIVKYLDMDGGIPLVSNVYINDSARHMNLKDGSVNDGWYYYEIYGSELNIGNNVYYFYFVDDERNPIRLPSNGSFEGPFVISYPTPTSEISLTPTPSFTNNPTSTITETPIPTGIITPTPVITLAPTITPTGTQDEHCFTITNPAAFYYKSFLLSWGPVYSIKAHYLVEVIIQGVTYTFDNIEDNWIRVTAENELEWQFYVSLGVMSYRVTAHDENHDILTGPTAWSEFRCYNSEQQDPVPNIPMMVDPGCLRISSPDNFEFNTILLSWTPIKGSSYYVVNYRYENWVNKLGTKKNWWYVTFPDELSWRDVIHFGKVFYSVTAFDSNNKILDGPTPWSYFVCK